MILEVIKLNSHRVQMSFTVESSFGQVPFKVVLVTGVCRSGKSTISNLLASFEGVNHSDEPWLPLTLPSMVNSGLIQENIASQMLKASIAEIYNESVLLRNANFRPSDQSSIWKQHDPNEIMFRLNHLNSRKDVEIYSREKKGVLLLNLPESLGHIGFFSKNIPSLKVLHPFRHPSRVAYEIFVKQWYSNEQLFKPKNAQLYFELRHKGKKWYIPSWIDVNDRVDFIEMSTEERSFFYWVTFFEQAGNNLQGKNTLNLFFDDFLQTPNASMEKIAKWLGKKTNSFTETRLIEIQKINKTVLPKIPAKFLSQIDSKLKKKGFSIFEELIKQRNLC